MHSPTKLRSHVSCVGFLVSRPDIMEFLTAVGYAASPSNTRSYSSGLGFAVLSSGAYTRPLFGSTSAHFVGYVGCMSFPESIRQGDTGRCDQNGLG